MSLDSIQRELWLGEIPVCFTLNTEDLAALIVEPEPCCVMLPSYLPLYLSEVKQYFSGYVKTNLKDSEVWCETKDGDKIKWHLPVGVSYDMINGLSSGKVWHLTVNFSDYPEQVLLRCPSTDCVKAHFLSTVKEADSLKHSSAVMNNIRESENHMLWNGMLTRGFDEFWSINRRLMECKSSKQPLGYKTLPIRVYKPDRKYSQPLTIAPNDEEQTPNITVSDLLQQCAIDLDDNMTVISQGIEIPLDSYVYDLTLSLSYPDNFLYLCVVRASPSDTDP